MTGIEYSHGGYGKVYAINLFDGDTKIAVKELYSHGDDEDMFKTEMINLIKVNNPRVVRFLGYENSDRVRKIHMEWLEGETLEKYLELNGNKLGIRSRLRILSNICKAVQAIHSAHVLHRDLKADNVFVCSGDIDEIKLIDFGLSLYEKEISEGTANLTDFNSETSPPENEGKIAIVDVPGEIWTLGLLSLNILNAKNWGSIRAVKEEGVGTIKWDDTVPLQVRRSVEKCLSHNPRYRYKSVRDFRLDIDCNTPDVDWSVRAIEGDLIILEGVGNEIEGAIASEGEYCMYRLYFKGIRSCEKGGSTKVFLEYNKDYRNHPEKFRKYPKATKEFAYKKDLIPRMVIKSIQKLKADLKS